MAGRKEQGSRRSGQQESKASRTAMAGRDNAKRKGDGKWREKGNGKEEEGKKFGQQFCRLFLAPESGERMRIPPAFFQYLQNHPTRLMSLKGQSGNTWPAKLSSDTEGLFFGHGWKEFVMDHSIESGHILTFSYDGHSQFSVVVFDGLCIEKSSAFHAKPSNDLVCTIESDEEDNDISSASVDYKSASLNSTEDSDSPNCVLEESVPHNDSSKFSPMFRISKEVDESGKTVVKVQRGPEAMSQRLPVSEDQKNYALQKAKQYKSKYPTTVEIMKDTNAYKTFFMVQNFTSRIKEQQCSKSR